MGSGIIVLVIVISLFMSTPGMAGEVGRYQATPVGDTLYILDTKEGHIWTCGENREQEQVRGSVVYLGKIRPGKRMGEVIEEATPEIEQPGRGVIKIMDRDGEVIRVINWNTIEFLEERMPSMDD